MTAPIRPTRSLYDEYLAQQRGGQTPAPSAPPAPSGDSLYARYQAEQHAHDWTGGDWGNLARSTLGQGVAAGFGDELEAAARAPFSDRSYGEIRDEIRGGLKEFDQRHHAANVTGELLGGVAGALIPVGEAARVVGTGAKLARAARTGAVIGGVTGLGKAEGGAGTQTASALEGAGLGAAFGLGTQSGGELIKRVLAASNASPRALSALSRAPVPDWVRRFLEQRAAASLDHAADRNVVERLVQDEVTPTQAAAFLRDAPERIPVAVADAGEENTRQGFAALKRLPGKQKALIKQVVDARDAQAPTWMRQSLREHAPNDAAALGLDPATIDTRTANPNTITQSAREALGERSDRRFAFLDGPARYDEPALTELATLSTRPSLAKGSEYGRRIAAEAGEDIPTLSLGTRQAPSRSGLVDRYGAAVQTTEPAAPLPAPSLRQLYWTKIGQDKYIAELADRVHTGNANGENVSKASVELAKAMKTRDQYRSLFARLAPDLDAAINAHADEAAPISAFVQGRKLPTTALPEDIETKLVTARNDEARAAMGSGYLRRLGNEVGRAQRQNGNPVKAVVGSGAEGDPMLTNLRQLAPSAAPGIEQDATLIQRVKATNAAVKGNSSTAERTAEDAAQVKKLIHGVLAAAKAAGGRPLSAVQAMLDGTYGPEAEATARKLLLGAQPGERAAAIQYLEQLAKNKQIQQVLQGSRTRSLGGATGGYIGGRAAAAFNAP